MAKARGFTLIELVIVVAIVGILMAIAIPAYQDQMRKGRRADAAAFLANVSQKQQQYRLDARTYATTLADLNVVPPAAVTDFYAVSLNANAGPPPTFLVTATATGSQVKDGDLSINQDGTKTRMVSGVDKGW